MEETDSKTDLPKWPQGAIRDVCTIEKIGRMPVSRGHHLLSPRPGDVLVVEAGEQFRASVCDGSELSVKGAFVVLRAGDKIIPEFLAMVVERKSFFKTVESWSRGGGSFMPNRVLMAMDLRRTIERVHIGVPPLDEQKQIVLNSDKYLTHIKSLAANFRQLGETLDKLHVAMAGQMLERKVGKAEIRELLLPISRMMPAGRQASQANDDDAKPRPPPKP